MSEEGEEREEREEREEEEEEEEESGEEEEEELFKTTAVNEEGHAASRSHACLRRSRRRKRRRSRRRSRRRKVYSGANAVNKKDPERDRATQEERIYLHFILLFASVAIATISR